MPDELAPVRASPCSTDRGGDEHPDAAVDHDSNFWTVDLNIGVVYSWTILDTFVPTSVIGIGDGHIVGVNSEDKNASVYRPSGGSLVVCVSQIAH